MSEIKKSVGRPAVNATAITVRVPPELLAPLDAFCAAEHDKLGRPEAIRRILTDDLQRRGFLPSTGAPDEGKRPDELDSTNDD